MQRVVAASPRAALERSAQRRLHHAAAGWELDQLGFPRTNPYAAKEKKNSQDGFEACFPLTVVVRCEDDMPCEEAPMRRAVCKLQLLCYRYELQATEELCTVKLHGLRYTFLATADISIANSGEEGIPAYITLVVISPIPMSMMERFMSHNSEELFDQIVRKGRLPDDEARFYAAEIVDILECLHNVNLIHQDAKAASMEDMVTKTGLTLTEIINLEQLPVIVSNSLFSSQISHQADVL
uniref:Protein kinase domain-containing protein n=1 Tax=Leersia perrieri TaxID=77586 RepID=A0A0D9WUV1_9ORYZ